MNTCTGYPALAIEVGLLREAPTEGRPYRFWVGQAML